MTWSAVSFRGSTICYEIEDGRIARVRELGRSEPFPLTDELRAAIAADLDRQTAKAQQP